MKFLIMRRFLSFFREDIVFLNSPFLFHPFYNPLNMFTSYNPYNRQKIISVVTTRLNMNL
jgi:hypothetical protein